MNMNMNQGPLNSSQIMNMLNQNITMKAMIYFLIQDPMMMNQAFNIINSLYYNPSTMNEIKNSINNEINMMNNNFIFMNNIIPFPNMNQMINPNNSMNNPNMINVTFVNNKTNKKTNVNGFLHEKISDIINKYKRQSGDTEDLYFFFFNGMKLNISKTLEETGLCEGSSIYVINRKDIMGG